MKTWEKIVGIVVLLSLHMLILTSCNKVETQKVMMGRYIEQDMPFEEADQMDVFDSVTHELSRSIEFKQDTRNLKLCGGGQGIYAINKEGIWHLAKDGDIWEQVMSSEGVSLGLPTSHLYTVCFAQGTFITQQLSGEGYVYKAYQYSKTTPSKPDKELTAYMLTENTAFREAMMRYGIAHPEVYIHVIQGVGKDGTVSKEDAVRSLNTEILAGKGPDLLLMDDLDLETYQKEGVLVNLNELSGKETLIPAMQKAISGEHGLYAVPLRFTTYALIGDEKLLDQVSGDGNILEELAKYQQAHPEESVMADPGAETLYRVAAPMMLYSGQEINEEQVSRLLQTVKVLRQMDQKNEIWEELGSVEDCRKAKQVIEGAAKLQMIQIKRADDLLLASDILKKANLKGFKLMTQDDKTYFNPKALVGINQNSKQKELAKEIVSFILDEKLQSIETRDGMPTNEAAFEEKLTAPSDPKHYFRFRAGNPEEFALTASWENAMLIPVFKEEMKTISLPAYQNHEVLDEMIIEAAKPYWKGDKSLEEVLENLMPKLSLKSQELNQK